MKFTFVLYALILVLIAIDIIFINQPIDKNAIGLIYNSCKLKMENNGCGLSKSTLEIDKSITEIYFAGFGYLTTTNYNRLKNSNTNMCKLIENECTDNSISEICRFAKKIYLK